MINSHKNYWKLRIVFKFKIIQMIKTIKFHETFFKTFKFMKYNFYFKLHENILFYKFMNNVLNIFLL